MIPAFDKDGNLPPGIYEVTWSEFCARYGYTKRRKELLAGLKKALEHLKDVGCQYVWVDGSFVTSKHMPNDFDACWSEAGVDFVELRSRYPALLTFANKRALQKSIYEGELFPATEIAFVEPLSGISLAFLEFFQKNRSGQSKGIIKLIP